MENSQKLIERYYDSFNKKDLQSFLSTLDNEVVHEICQGDTEIGIDAFTRFMKRMDKAYDEQATKLVVMSNPEGSHLAAKFVIEGLYKSTDGNLPEAKQQKYTLNCGAFFEVKNQKITRISNHYNMKEWLAQVKE